MRNLIIEKLKTKGYDVEPIDVEKNSIVKKGIRLSASSGVSVTPVIYPEDFRTVREAITYAEMMFSSPAPAFNPELFEDWDYVKDHITVCVQKKSKELIEKEDFLDFECYLRVFINETSSYKVTSSIMTLLTAKAGDADKVWETAYLNTREKEHYEIKSDEFLFSIRTCSHAFGGNAIIFTDRFAAMAKEANTDFIVLPVSTEYTCVLPNLVENILDIHYLINDIIAIIPPEERLSDCAYIMRVGSDTFEKIS